MINFLTVEEDFTLFRLLLISNMSNEKNESS